MSDLELQTNVFTVICRCCEEDPFPTWSLVNGDYSHLDGFGINTYESDGVDYTEEIDGLLYGDVPRPEEYVKFSKIMDVANDMLALHPRATLKYITVEG